MLVRRTPLVAGFALLLGVVGSVALTWSNARPTDTNLGSVRPVVARLPGRVTGLRVAPGGVSVFGGKVAKVSWSRSPGATAYLLASRLMTDAGSPWSSVPGQVTTRSWTFQPLLTGRRYEFRVRPVDGRLQGRPTTSAPTRMRGVPAGRLYAALGDSYSSGLGASGHETGGSCHRSAGAWAHRLQPRDQRSTKLLACASATMSSVTDQLKAMNTFFAQHPDAPQLITITVGGNDVGFSDVLRKCVEQSCTGSENALLDRITAIRPLMTAFFRQLRALHPYADIVAGGYPQVLEPTGPSTNPLCERINYPERQMITRLSNHLNMVIAEAADDARIWTVGLMVKQQFLGHNACADGVDEWIHAGTLKVGGMAGILSPQTFHPKDPGQEAYADAFGEAIVGRAG